MLVLILALLNGQPPSPAPPSALPGAVASVGEAVNGTWTGEWAQAGARAPVGLEAAFTTGAAKTVVAYFTFIERGMRRTVLRQGTSAAGGLRFAWPGGRRLDLRLTGADRLEGDVIAIRPEGAAAVPAGSMSLSRRPR